VEDLRSELMYMLLNPEKAHEMGTRFKAKISNQHTWKSQVSGILSVVFPVA
jgi:hypothetical protein